RQAVSRADQLRLANRDSVTSDRFRSRLRAATVPDAPNLERVALMDKKLEGRKTVAKKKAQPPFPVLTIPEASKNSALETSTTSGVSLTVGAVSSFSDRESSRSDTHASECSSLAPYWIPEEIKHYFRHRHSEEDESSGKTDVALREIGLERELPAIDDSNWSRWAGTWCRNPRHALVVVMAVMTGALLAVLLAAVMAEFHIALPGFRSRAGGAAAQGDDSAAAQGEGAEAGHGDFVMPTQKRANKRHKQAATPEEMQTARPREVQEVTSSAAVEEVMPGGEDATQMHSAAGSDKSRKASCACMMLTPHGAGLCNRGKNRFTSMERCQQECVDSGEPSLECYDKAVFAECEARDVVETWWWYLEGKGCRHWRFPRGHCPDGGDVFPTSLECVRRCVDAKGREPPCVAPKGVVCDVKYLRFGYIADASPRGSGARRCRQLPSAGGEAKLQHCLAGANKFPTLEACQKRCVPTEPDSLTHEQ
ncbi:hypothetical protein MTO96_051285, partial [Rhipicephalus appendiculatus]